jgi:hypothetical protein
MSATTGLQAEATQPDLPSTRHLESNSEQFFPDRSRDVIGEDHAGAGVRISYDVPPLDLINRAESTPIHQSVPKVDGSPVNRSAPLIYCCIDDLMTYFICGWSFRHDLTEPSTRN